MKNKLLLVLSCLTLSSCIFNFNESNFETIESEKVESNSESKIEEKQTESQKDQTSEKESNKEENISDITLNSNYLNNEYVKVCGKSYFENNSIVLSFSSSYIEVNFIGTKLEGYFEDSHEYEIKVYVDDKEPSLIKLPKTLSKVTLANNLENKEHTVKIYKINEEDAGSIKFNRILTDGNFNKVNKDKIKIEFFGDSITCGYGIKANHEDNPAFVVSEEDSTLTYMQYLSNYFDADYQATSASGWCLYKDDANYNEIEKSEIPTYFDYCDLTYNHSWNPSNFIPDIVIINLGTNDAYSGFELETTTIAKNKFLEGYKKKYKSFIEKIYNTYGEDTFVICLYGTMSIKDVFDKAISDVVDSINKDTCMYLKSKCLDKVSNKFMPCGHPNTDMHKYIAEEIYTLLFAWFEE